MIMSLEDMIVLLETKILETKQILRRNTMQSVLVQQTGFDPDPVRWNAYQWPEQRIIAQGLTRDEVISAFVDGWNARMRDTKTVEDFRFFGPLLVTAFLRETDAGWDAVAYAERAYSTEPQPTEEEAKTAFISMWNESHPDTDPVTDINIDWQYSNAPE